MSDSDFMLVEGCGLVDVRRVLPNGMSLRDAIINRDRHLKTAQEHHNPACRDLAGLRADILDSDIEEFLTTLQEQPEGAGCEAACAA